MDQIQKKKLEKSSSIKKMQQGLYSKQNTFKEENRKKLSQEDLHISPDWTDEAQVSEEQRTPTGPLIQKKMTIFTKILIGAFGFFCLSVAAMFAVFYFGQNSVGFDDVTVEVQGPTSIPGGEAFGYDVTITNNNPVDIVLSDVFIAYPTGAYVPGAAGETLSEDTQVIEELGPGESETLRFEATFFGEEGEQKAILITYQYRVRDSSNIFFKKREYTLVLETSPLSFRVEGPTQITTGNDLTFAMNVSSNANRVIENLGIQIDYPFGFQYATSSIETFNSTNDLFVLGTLGVGEEMEFTVTGSLSGQDDETRVFNYEIGLVDMTRQILSTALQRAQQVVTITRPPIALQSFVNGRAQSLTTIEAGDQITLKLVATNNTQSTIRDGELKLNISGNGFITSGINSRGFYDQRAGVITWDQTIIPKLSELGPGEEIEVAVTLNTPETPAMAGRITNPTTQLEYVFTGDTADTLDLVENVESKTAATIRTATELVHDSAVLFSKGPFENAGSIQLQADEENQYTIVWKVSNTTSKTERVVTTATLPIYVEYIQAQNVTGSVFQYDEQRKLLTWTVDAVEPGAGYATPGIEGVFQVSVSPSSSQEGESLDLTTNKQMTGSDTFSNMARIYNQLGQDSTRLLRADPQYRSGVDRVE